MSKREVLTTDQLKQQLLTLLDLEALEFGMTPDRKQVLIPYMMNDAAECYLALTDSAVQGELPASLEEGDRIEVLHQVREKEKQTRSGLIIRLIGGRVVTIWYREAVRITNCYQYHKIGHDWRKKRGEENIRRLVNLLCVLHDKRHYLGADGCTPKEETLADLAEFAPILFFTPIDREILEWYPQTMKGIRAAQHLFAAAGDEVLLRALEEYAQNFQREFPEARIRAFARLLASDVHCSIWNVLEMQITDASKTYAARSWGSSADAYAECMRTKAEESYLKQGFRKENERLVKYDAGGEKTAEIRFTEQQPFTILEAEDFHFRIFAERYDAAGRLQEWKKEADWQPLMGGRENL